MSELVERWPGYDEQSWAERFAELNRRHDGLFRSFNALHEEAIKALAEKRDRIEALERELGEAVAAERERCARIAEGCLAQCQSSASQFEFTSTEARHYRARANEAEIIAAAIRNGERG